MAGKGSGEIQHPSSNLVKYLNVLAAGIGIVALVLDAAVPVAQQLGKRKEAKEGLERAINMTILLALIRTVPQLFRQIRKLQAQLGAEVA